MHIAYARPAIEIAIYIEVSKAGPPGQGMQAGRKQKNTVGGD